MLRYCSKLMQTVLRERHAGPLVIVDEVEKAGDVNADISFGFAGSSFDTLPCLLVKEMQVRRIN